MYLEVEELTLDKHYPINNRCNMYNTKYNVYKCKDLTRVVNKIIKLVYKRYQINVAASHISNMLFKYGYLNINHFRFSI